MKKLITVLLIIFLPAFLGFAEEKGNVGFGFGTSFHKHQESHLKGASVSFFRLYGDPDNAVATETIKKGKAKVEVGALPKFAEDGFDLDVVAFTTGKGKDFRKWKVTDVKVEAGGETLRPVKGDNFYVKPGAAKTKPAAVVFTAVSTYVGPRSSSEESNGASSGSCAPGQPCGTSNGGSSSQEKKAPTEAERAATAAGMALLASQAGGEITGRKDTFHISNDLAKRIDPKKAQIKVTAENVNTMKKIRVKAKMDEMFCAINQVAQKR